LVLQNTYNLNPQVYIQWREVQRVAYSKQLNCRILLQKDRMNINPTCKRKGESLQINPKFIKTVEMHQINSDHLKRILTAVRIACFFLSEHQESAKHIQLLKIITLSK
jgi:hypothetical protein